MRNAVRLIAILLLIFTMATTAAAKKKHEPLATVSFLVVRDENGKPIRNAAVVLHPVGDNGKQERGGLELKTDPDGKTSYDGVPYGKLRIQVLAPGFQTYGEDYDVNEPNMDITVKMKRPAGQYSIYENHPAENKDQKPPEQNAKPQQ
jgi:Carboxypeptidase regulatory-like domain